MNFLEIGQEIKTQDNLCTADPIFVVQQRRRIYGMDPDYADKFVWLHDDEAVESDDEAAAKLEKEYIEAGDLEGTFESETGYRRVAYLDNWEMVTVCLTNKGAEEFIENQKHNYKELRVFVESAHRNPEWKSIRKFFKDLADHPTIKVPVRESASDLDCSGCPFDSEDGEACASIGDQCPEPGNYLLIPEDNK